MITVKREDFKRVVHDDNDPDVSYLKHPGGPLERLRQTEAGLMGQSKEHPQPSDEAFNLDELRADEADEERLAAYHRGEFHFVGVQARVTLFIPYGGDKIMQDIKSPGIWGIESDCDEPYLAEVFQDECDVLAHMLTELGVTVTP